jgi:hypothetical protein
MRKLMTQDAEDTGAAFGTQVRVRIQRPSVSAQLPFLAPGWHRIAITQRL